MSELEYSNPSSNIIVNPNVPEDGPIRPKYVVQWNVWYICATNFVEGNCNKAISFIIYFIPTPHLSSLYHNVASKLTTDFLQQQK
jgi:hypothetical protein